MDSNDDRLFGWHPPDEARLAGNEPFRMATRAVSIRTDPGGVVGGHAYCLAQVDVARRRVRIDNSWGADWGWNGSAWLDFDDLAELLQEQGECALPRPTKP